MFKKRLGIILLLLVSMPIFILACSTGDQPVLKVGGIPDQDSSRLARRYELFSDYLGDRLGVTVR